jgi:hypothetical protein
MSTYMTNVALSWQPYFTVGVFFMLLAVVSSPLIRSSPFTKINHQTLLPKLTWSLGLIGLVIWLWGLFLAFSTPANIPKRISFDKAASHQAIVEQQASRSPANQPIQDRTLKPESSDTRSERFKALTDYRSRAELRSAGD